MANHRTHVNYYCYILYFIPKTDEFVPKTLLICICTGEIYYICTKYYFYGENNRALYKYWIKSP